MDSINHKKIIERRREGEKERRRMRMRYQQTVHLFGNIIHMLIICTKYLTNYN
jgi:hypothetical protein